LALTPGWSSQLPSVNFMGYEKSVEGWGLCQAGRAQCRFSFERSSVACLHSRREFASRHGPGGATPICGRPAIRHDSTTFLSQASPPEPPKADEPRSCRPVATPLVSQSRANNRLSVQAGPPPPVPSSAHCGVLTNLSLVRPVANWTSTDLSLFGS